MGQACPPRSSVASSPTSTKSLLVFPRKRTLPDKLQLLILLSPVHVKIIENIVDLILARFNV